MGQGHIYPPGLRANERAALDANPYLDGTNYVAGIDDVGDGGGATSGFTVIRLAFAYNSSSPLTLAAVATGETVMKVILDLTTAFDQASTLSVGHTGSQTALMNTDQNDSRTAGFYEVVANQQYGGSDTVKLYVNAGLSTQGAGVCWLISKKA